MTKNQGRISDRIADPFVFRSKRDLLEIKSEKDDSFWISPWFGRIAGDDVSPAAVAFGRARIDHLERVPCPSRFCDDAVDSFFGFRRDRRFLPIVGSNRDGERRPALSCGEILGRSQAESTEEQCRG